MIVQVLLLPLLVALLGGRVHSFTFRMPQWAAAAPPQQQQHAAATNLNSNLYAPQFAPTSMAFPQFQLAAADNLALTSNSQSSSYGRMAPRFNMAFGSSGQQRENTRMRKSQPSLMYSSQGSLSAQGQIPAAPQSYQNLAAPRQMEAQTSIKSHGGAAAQQPSQQADRDFLSSLQIIDTSGRMRNLKDFGLGGQGNLLNERELERQLKHIVDTITGDLEHAEFLPLDVNSNQHNQLGNLFQNHYNSLGAASQQSNSHQKQAQQLQQLRPNTNEAYRQPSEPQRPQQPREPQLLGYRFEQPNQHQFQHLMPMRAKDFKQPEQQFRSPAQTLREPKAQPEGGYQEQQVVAPIAPVQQVKIEQQLDVDLPQIQQQNFEEKAPVQQKAAPIYQAPEPAKDVRPPAQPIVQQVEPIVQQQVQPFEEQKRITNAPVEQQQQQQQQGFDDEPAPLKNVEHASVQQQREQPQQAKTSALANKEPERYEQQRQTSLDDLPPPQQAPIEQQKNEEAVGPQQYEEARPAQQQQNARQDAAKGQKLDGWVPIVQSQKVNGQAKPEEQQRQVQIDNEQQPVREDDGFDEKKQLNIQQQSGAQTRESDFRGQGQQQVSVAQLDVAAPENSQQFAAGTKGGSQTGFRRPQANKLAKQRFNSPVVIGGAAQPSHQQSFENNSRQRARTGKAPQLQEQVGQVQEQLVEFRQQQVEEVAGFKQQPQVKTQSTFAALPVSAPLQTTPKPLQRERTKTGRKVKLHKSDQLRSPKQKLQEQLQLKGTSELPLPPQQQQQQQVKQQQQLLPVAQLQPSQNLESTGLKRSRQSNAKLPPVARQEVVQQQQQVVQEQVEQIRDEPQQVKEEVPAPQRAPLPLIQQVSEEVQQTNEEVAQPKEPVQEQVKEEDQSVKVDEPQQQLSLQEPVQNTNQQSSSGSSSSSWSQEGIVQQNEDFGSQKAEAPRGQENFTQQQQVQQTSNPSLKELGGFAQQRAEQSQQTTTESITAEQPQQQKEAADAASQLPTVAPVQQQAEQTGFSQEDNSQNSQVPQQQEQQKVTEDDQTTVAPRQQQQQTGREEDDERIREVAQVVQQMDKQLQQEQQQNVEAPQVQTEEVQTKTEPEKDDDQSNATTSTQRPPTRNRPTAVKTKANDSDWTPTVPSQQARQPTKQRQIAQSNGNKSQSRVRFNTQRSQQRFNQESAQLPAEPRNIFGEGYLSAHQLLNTYNPLQFEPERISSLQTRATESSVSANVNSQTSAENY